MKRYRLYAIWFIVAAATLSLGQVRETEIRDGNVVDTIAILQTTAASDGDVYTVNGYAAAGDAGDPWEMTYHVTGRSALSLIGINGGTRVIGPGADDYWEAVELKTLYSRRFGIVDDWVYAVGGTDQTSNFNRLFLAAESGTDVVISPGNYNIHYTGYSVQAYTFGIPATGTQAATIEPGETFGGWTVRQVNIRTGTMAANTAQGVIYVEATGTPAQLSIQDYNTSGGGRLAIEEFDHKIALNVPYNINLYAKGATLHNNYLAIDRNVLEFTGAIGGRKIELPDVLGSYNVIRPTLAEEEFAAIRFSGRMTDSDIYLSGCRRMGVGLLLHPEPSKFISYNRFYGGIFAGTKVGLEIRGNTFTGWVNENSFYGPDFTSSSDSLYLGSNYAIKMSRVPGGYPGPNNMRVNNACFQVLNYVEATHKLTIGKAISTNQRYVNRDVDLGSETYAEYICDVVGTGGVATVPTHLAGQVTDANGYKFTYVGKWWFVPIYHANGCGSLNTFTGCRWEGGDGPLVLIERDGASQCYGNSYEVYKASSDGTRSSPQIRQLQEDEATATNYQVLSNNHVSTYGSQSGTVVSVTNIHRRLIGSSGNYTLAGFSWRDYFVNGTNVKHVSGPVIKLLNDGLWVVGTASDYLGTFVNFGNNDRIRYSAVEPESQVATGEPTRVLLQFFKDRARVSIASNTDRLFGTNTGTSPNLTYMVTGTQPNVSSNLHIIKDHDRCDEVFVGAIYATGGIRHLQFFAESYIGYKYDLGLESWFGEDTLNPKQRSAYGTPDVGYFENLGEYIVNLNTTGGQPLGWRVTTAGVLAPQWTTLTAYKNQELVSNAGKIYRAGSEDTSGVTAPTGTTTSNDGTILWTYKTVEPVLTASTETY